MSSLSIGAAALILGVCINTLRNWEKSGSLVPRFRRYGGHRRYTSDDISKLINKPTEMANRPTIAYARVSTHDQKHDLQTQIERLELECAKRGFDAEVISDLGSGMNYKKKGLRRLIGMLYRHEIGRLVVIRQDRLLRFGAELIYELCRLSGCDRSLG